MQSTEKQDDKATRWAAQHDLEKRARALVVKITVALLVPLAIVGGYFLWDMRQLARRASCMNDIAYLREVLLRYAADHDGKLPRLNPTRGNLTMDPEGFYPDYLDNSCWLQCEWSESRRNTGSAGKNDDLGLSGFTDDSFCYLPWALNSEAEGLAFIEAYKTGDLDHRDVDLVVAMDGVELTLKKTTLSDSLLNKNLESDSPPVPILVEWPDKFHRDGNVLLSNGSIVALELDKAFPMTTAFINGLREIASLDKPLTKR